MTIQRAQPLVVQVYEHLRSAILTGELEPGEKINETQLAAQLKVSRSPVREAIRLLTTEQLLVEKDGMIQVFKPSLDDFLELYEVRLTIEPAVAAKAAACETNQAVIAVLAKISRIHAPVWKGKRSKVV